MFCGAESFAQTGPPLNVPSYVSIPIRTREDLYASNVAFFQAAHRDPMTGNSPSLGPQSFLGNEAAAITEVVADVLETAKAVDNDSVPGGIYVDEAGVTRTRNSSQALDDYAYVYALPRFGGGYGRNPALAARSGAATASGTVGLVITAESEATDPTGQVVVKTRLADGDKTIGGGGTVAVVFDAVSTGTQGNLAAGTILRWTSPPPGLSATLTLTTVLSGGAEVEDDISVATRLVELLRNPAAGGRLSDWRVWSLLAQYPNSDALGIVEAYRFAHRDGTGSITIVPSVAGSGASRVPTTQQVTALQTWLDALKIETDTVYVLKPRLIAGQELSIVASVTPSDGFGFDWAGYATVDYGTGTSLVLFSSAPPTLTAAIAAGGKPRVALLLPGSALPFVSRATGYAANTPVVGLDTLTLETAMPSSPTSGDKLWPAGGCTLPIAASILAHVDSLGPSRSSGFASTVWPDKVTIGGIAAATLSARDSSSGELVCAVADGVGSAQMTIAVGAGSPTGNDYQTVDSSPTLGPQIPEVKSILVRAAA